jgi:hypothetical protein
MCVGIYIYIYKLHAKYQWEKLKESEHLDNLGVKGGIIEIQPKAVGFSVAVFCTS